MNAYVFVACGSSHHLDRLDRARGTLRQLTEHEIVVVTDGLRNSRKLDGPEQIIEVSTNPDWSDKQAAIALKTRLPELLDRDGIWCYLDTDVVAVDPRVDEVFSAYKPPVTFAENATRPGATLRRFSPYAVDCPCGPEMRRLEQFFARLDEISAFHREQGDLSHLADPAFYRDMVFRGRRKFLLWGSWRQGVATLRDPSGNLLFEQEWLAGQPRHTVYHFPESRWRLVQDHPATTESRLEDDHGHSFRFHTDDELRGGGYWENEEGDSFRETIDGEAWWFRSGEPRRRRSAGTDGSSDAWFDASGEILGECDHLAEALERDFGIAIPNRRWREWNGGVFLFSRDAVDFFAQWHHLCLDIFGRSGWAVRDQGALVGIAHRLGLTSHPCLPQRFNRIVDPHDPACRELSLSGLRDQESVRFLHLIHGGPGGRDLTLWRDLDAWMAEIRD